MRNGKRSIALSFACAAVLAAPAFAVSIPVGTVHYCVNASGTAYFSSYPSSHSKCTLEGGTGDYNCNTTGACYNLGSTPSSGLPKGRTNVAGSGTPAPKPQMTPEESAAEKAKAEEIAKKLAALEEERKKQEYEEQLAAQEKALKEAEEERLKAEAEEKKRLEAERLAKEKAEAYKKLMADSARAAEEAKKAQEEKAKKETSAASAGVTKLKEQMQVATQIHQKRAAFIRNDPGTEFHASSKILKNNLLSGFTGSNRGMSDVSGSAGSEEKIEHKLAKERKASARGGDSGISGREPASLEGDGGESELHANGNAAGKAGKSARDGKGRRSAESGAGREGTDPWVEYMADVSKDDLVSQLRGSAEKRTSLKEQIAALLAKNDPQDSEMIALLEEVLEEAEQTQSETFADLLPISVREAFSMDSDETRRQVDGLLAELSEQSGAQFLPQETLFQRVTATHRRSVERGSVKALH